MVAATFQPILEKCCTVARPMPLEVPVIKTVFAISTSFKIV
jgi:hypothetical protein